MKLGGLLSVALSRGSPQVDVIHHSCPMESGLSSMALLKSKSTAIIRPTRLTQLYDTHWLDIEVSQNWDNHIQTERLGRIGR